MDTRSLHASSLTREPQVADNALGEVIFDLGKIDLLGLSKYWAYSSAGRATDF